MYKYLVSLEIMLVRKVHAIVHIYEFFNACEVLKYSGLG